MEHVHICGYVKLFKFCIQCLILCLTHSRNYKSTRLCTLYILCHLAISRASPEQLIGYTELSWSVCFFFLKHLSRFHICADLDIYHNMYDTLNFHHVRTYQVSIQIKKQSTEPICPDSILLMKRSFFNLHSRVTLSDTAHQYTWLPSNGYTAMCMSHQLSSPSPAKFLFMFLNT